MTPAFPRWFAPRPLWRQHFRAFWSDFLSILGQNQVGFCWFSWVSSVKIRSFLVTWNQRAGALFAAAQLPFPCQDPLAMDHEDIWKLGETSSIRLLIRGLGFYRPTVSSVLQLDPSQRRMSGWTARNIWCYATTWPLELFFFSHSEQQNRSATQ